MAIIQLRENKQLPETLACIICARRVSNTEAVAGLLDAEGRQHFACNGHFWNPHQFIAGWADFMAHERAKRTRNQFAFEYGEGMDAQAVR